MNRADAIKRARRLLSVNPYQALLIIELSNRLRVDDQIAEALSWARWGVRPERWPNGQIDPRAWQLLGNLLLDFGRFDEADLAFGHADPLCHKGRLQNSRAQACLGKGDLQTSWTLAERRWLIESLADDRPPVPHWDGWPKVNQLMLWDEQGFGDTLQALRWIPELSRPGLSLTIDVRVPLQRLLQEGLTWLQSDLKVCVREERDWQNLCHGSLLSLPMLLKAQQWPNPVVLRLPKPDRASGSPRVALVWESGRYLDDPSLALEYRRKTIPDDHRQSLCSALHAKGIEVVLLQPGFDLNATADFYEQALLMQQCDLLLSVDTAAAHLGGVIGHPTWLLLPWAAASRWRRHCSQTELYPGRHVLRQPRHGDWPGLMVQLLEDIDRWLQVAVF